RAWKTPSSGILLPPKASDKTILASRITLRMIKNCIFFIVFYQYKIPLLSPFEKGGLKRISGSMN
ncbi:hypothetical protein COY52_09510, partial [Candidatus Desantisbacteria bacterium CG_4_10_14_0_8_um_filter_48_22]